jgi:hypothetical protein
LMELVDALSATCHRHMAVASHEICSLAGHEPMRSAARRTLA